VQADRLQAVTAAALAKREPTPDLRAAVVEYTCAMKGAGHPPERVVIAVKEAAWALRTPSIEMHVREAIREDMVRVCIAAYYRVDKEQSSLAPADHRTSPK
jgi:hypothetical protein